MTADGQRPPKAKKAQQGNTKEKRRRRRRELGPDGGMELISVSTSRSSKASRTSKAPCEKSKGEAPQTEVAQGGAPQTEVTQGVAPKLQQERTISEGTRDDDDVASAGSSTSETIFPQLSPRTRGETPQASNKDDGQAAKPQTQAMILTSGPSSDTKCKIVVPNAVALPPQDGQVGSHTKVIQLSVSR